VNRAGRRPIIVLGCSSSAGKSLLATGIVRWFARQGVDVVPFKAQNMSNNARVVHGGEIGVAQWLQSVAAGVVADVRMNPVLVKPEGDDRSQVVVNGVVDRAITALPWRERAPALWPAITAAFDELRAEHELVVLEGAGSPAEINLPDLANNRILDHADASALLVADIDRGGAFAHLYGTWSLVPDGTRRRVAGFVLNKFRGNAALLDPGPAILEERTGVACAGVVPMLHHELPDEEGATVRVEPEGAAPEVAVVRYPYASNLDEFHLLAHVARVRYATRPTDLALAAMVILPGSKHVAADATWLREHGFVEPLRSAAASGQRVLGVCGGAMLVGRAITDPAGVEGGTTGLGLLPLDTRMHGDKIVRRVEIAFRDVPAPWSALDGVSAAGYEIRHGRVHPAEGMTPVSPGLVWAERSVLATTVHGLLEDPEVLHALFGRRPPPVLDRTCDQLADAVEEHLDTDLLQAMTDWT
jgi:adenosylcobyric acid synthase